MYGHRICSQVSSDCTDRVLGSCCRLLPCVAAKAQLPISAPAPVSVGSVIPFSHGKTGVWTQIYSMKVDPLHGHILFLDSAASDLYDLAPGASTPTEIIGPEPSNKDASDCSLLEYKGSYWNSGIAFDKWDNLYITDRYGASVEFCRIPYNSSSGTWVPSSADIWAGPTYTSSGKSVAIPPQDLQVADDGVTFYVSTSDTESIFKYTVDEAGDATNVTAVATGLETMVASLAVDHAGNVFFIENPGSYPTNVQGIREIPAGTSFTGNSAGSESSLTRIDQGGWDGIDGVYFDKEGDLYFSNENNSSYGGLADGIFMVPNEGTPTSPMLVWADTVMVAPLSAGWAPMIDPRGLLWIATSWYSNWAPAGVNGPTCDTTDTATEDATCLESSIVVWKPGALNLGSTPVGGSTAVSITAYSEGSGGGTLTLTANNSFTENELVTISAKSTDPLYVLNGLSFYVSGTGLSSTAFEISSSTIAASASGSTSATATVNQTQAIYYMFNKATTPASFTLAKPSNASFTTVANYPTLSSSTTNPVNPCTGGTSYPAFSASMTTTATYSWCPYYVQLSTTMAGAVEGELQTLDSSGDVIGGSNAYLTGIGQGAAAAAIASPTVEYVASGLDEPLQVAADLWGNTYVADYALKAIEKYAAGVTSPASGKVVSKSGSLTNPTGVAVDGVGNVYIGDAGTVYIVPFVNGALVPSEQAALVTGLGSQLNLAVDGEGDVFVADKANKQVVEIPNPQTALLIAGAGESYVTLGSSAGFTGPSAIATDSSGNVWVADGKNLWEISMPYGGLSEVITGGVSGVTGLAVDPSARSLWREVCRLAPASAGFRIARPRALSISTGRSR